LSNEEIYKFVWKMQRNGMLFSVPNCFEDDLFWLFATLENNHNNHSSSPSRISSQPSSNTTTGNNSSNSTSTKGGSKMSTAATKGNSHSKNNNSNANTNTSTSTSINKSSVASKASRNGHVNANNDNNSNNGISNICGDSSFVTTTPTTVRNSIGCDDKIYIISNDCTNDHRNLFPSGRSFVRWRTTQVFIHLFNCIV